MLFNATGWTLIHFLWQGTIITVLFALADALSRRASAGIRYGIAGTAMLLMLACAGATFYQTLNASGADVPVMASGNRVAPSSPAPATGLATAPGRLSHDYLSWLVYCWMAGVVALSIRLTVQWLMLQRCRRHGIRMLDTAWQERVSRIASRLQLSRAVRAYESAIADVPAVIGWIRPIILLPASAITQLSPAQIEALLAHELAHVRRHDYLVNLLQSCVETMFFYHPGVWWIGRRMREERENCCDDLAVAACGDPVIYARALAKLEQLRGGLPGLAIAANGGRLLSRIQRLIAAPREPRRPIAPIGITGVALLVASAFLWAAPPQEPPSQAIAPSSKAPIVVAQANVQPAKPQTPKPPPPPKAPPAKNEESFLDQLERNGLRNLSVDQMIAMKIHGVTADYIDEIKSLGWTATPDQLVSFRIHGVNAESVKELRALGYELTPDQAVSARVHGINPAFANGWKQEGLTNLDFHDLTSLKIHGATPGTLAELKSLGFKQISAKDLVHLHVMGVTPGFVREVRKRGFNDLTLDQIVKIKQFGLLGSDTK
jgi:beta-lactamase regulating signal transducer with metallopeptidase domain